MTFLRDVNVRIAPIAAEHSHSGQAQAFVEQHAGDTLALCRITQMAILRLPTNSHVMGPDVKTAEEAWKIFDRLTGAD
jgi:predicted nucleic acid-binding protein